jgi:hypothetical protein
MREAYLDSGGVIPRIFLLLPLRLFVMDREKSAPKSRELLSKALFESALIVFSILLALAINEWKEDRDNQRLASQALENFEREIQENSGRVERSFPYHRHLSEAFKRARFLTEVEGWHGISSPVLQDTAWQTALATNAFGQIRYETVSALSQVYTSQKSFEKIADDVVTSLVNQGLSDATKGLMNDLLIAEMGLRSAYEQALKRIHAERHE